MGIAVVAASVVLIFRALIITLVICTILVALYIAWYIHWR